MDGEQVALVETETGTEFETPVEFLVVPDVLAVEITFDMIFVVFARLLRVLCYLQIYLVVLVEAAHAECKVRSGLSQPFQIVGQIEAERSHNRNVERIAAGMSQFVVERLGGRFVAHDCIVVASVFKKQPRLDREELANVEVNYNARVEARAPAV